MTRFDATGLTYNDVRRQADQDTVYEQDLLRDAGSVKPWLAYIEYKQQHGTLYEQAFVCSWAWYLDGDLLLTLLGDGARV